MACAVHHALLLWAGTFLSAIWQTPAARQDIHRVSEILVDNVIDIRAEANTPKIPEARQKALENLSVSRVCPDFQEECVFQTERTDKTNGGTEVVQCKGNVTLIKKLGLTTPIALDVNGPWAAMLMQGVKTIETRSYAFRPEYTGLPIAMMDTRNFPSLVEAIAAEPLIREAGSGFKMSQQGCILGQLAFQQSIQYLKANSSDVEAFEAAFEQDPVHHDCPHGLPCGGHRVPCTLPVYADQFKKDAMYGWHVQPGTARTLQVTVSGAQRTVVDAVGRWGNQKTDNCFLPEGDMPGEPDNLMRTYATGWRPLQFYQGRYFCTKKFQEIEGSFKCLGKVVKVAA